MTQILEKIPVEQYNLEKLVKENQSRVYNVCLSILQNPSDAEDISQEAFIHIFKNIEQFRSQAELSTWIYRVTVNKCLEELRSRKRKKRWGRLISLGVSFDDEVDVPHFEHPGVLLENKERAEVLFAMMNRLPDKQKVAFTLHKIEGLSYKEISDIMQISLSAVESLLHRAKNNLKKALKEYYQKQWI
ncbi:MAG: RNA polymerase sigma factor [Cyclobacteriaceae bacterium]